MNRFQRFQNLLVRSKSQEFVVLVVAAAIPALLLWGYDKYQYHRLLKQADYVEAEDTEEQPIDEKQIKVVGHNIPESFLKAAHESFHKPYQYDCPHHKLSAVYVESDDCILCIVGEISMPPGLVDSGERLRVYNATNKPIPPEFLTLAHSALDVRRPRTSEFWYVSKELGLRADYYISDIRTVCIVTTNETQ